MTHCLRRLILQRLEKLFGLASSILIRHIWDGLDHFRSERPIKGEARSFDLGRRRTRTHQSRLAHPRFSPHLPRLSWLAVSSVIEFQIS